MDKDVTSKLYTMKRLLLILAVCFSILDAFGQKQGNFWFFGDGAGLDFSSGSPVAITDGQTYVLQSHSEGTSVISDHNGSLLFYSNGEKVWDRNHDVMPNGDSLLGHYSSTHAALIVPMPGDVRYYYLFTTDAFQNNLRNGFRYSIIDMCLNEQLGDVDKNQKNILLLDTVSEKIAATRHSNNLDYWIITQKYFTNAFYAYRLTGSGIVDTVISHVGTIHQGHVAGAIGQIKFSPDGSKLGVAGGNGNNLIEVFDFDNATGMVSMPINLPRNSTDTRGYGVSFSSDNSKVYFFLTTIVQSTESYIAQFDLNAGVGHPDSIKESQQVVLYISNVSCSRGGLQLGPDKKIYKVSCQDNQYLDVIHDPDSSGQGSNFQGTYLYLGGKRGSHSLPSFLDSYDYQNIDIDCEGTGTNGKVANADFAVYPNPLTNQSVIVFDNPNQKRFMLLIYDTQGRILKSIGGITSNQVVVERGNLSVGLYLFQICSAEGDCTYRKIMVN